MYKVKLDGYVLYNADHPSAMLTDPVLGKRSIFIRLIINSTL